MACDHGHVRIADPTRMLYLPDSGYEVFPQGLAVIAGGTIFDFDLGLYRLTRVGGIYSKALGSDSELIALEGEVKQYCVFENRKI